MRRYLPLYIFLWLLMACAAPVAPTPVVVPPDAANPITDETGETVALQPGGEWVLISGVDEHGLIAEHDLLLLEAPQPDALPSGGLVHTGTAAAVREIRHGGPQSLQRFFLVETTGGAKGWISDYYVRRQAYLYDPTAEDVTLYSEPDGDVVATLSNVSPVRILNPRNADWWEVAALDGGAKGWVQHQFVKESADRQFLTGEAHEHGD